MPDAPRREVRQLRPVRGRQDHPLVPRGRRVLDRRVRDLRHADGRVAVARHRPVAGRPRPHARRARPRHRRGVRRALRRRQHAQHPRPLPRPRSAPRVASSATATAATAEGRRSAPTVVPTTPVWCSSTRLPLGSWVKACRPEPTGDGSLTSMPSLRSSAIVSSRSSTSRARCWPWSSGTGASMRWICWSPTSSHAPPKPKSGRSERSTRAEDVDVEPSRLLDVADVDGDVVEPECTHRPDSRAGSVACGERSERARRGGRRGVLRRPRRPLLPAGCHRSAAAAAVPGRPRPRRSGTWRCSSSSTGAVRAPTARSGATRGCGPGTCRS